MSTPIPGSYGPVFEEPGFHEKGGYFNSGFQATVNHYGGNLVVSASDVNIASQGKFGLFFKRTHNSNKIFVPDLTNIDILTQVDSPLGIGWTAHYGILLPTGWVGSQQPQFVDNTGARHLFYPHNHLNNQIDIQSPGGHPTWISLSLEILMRTNDDNFIMLTPDGLKYELERKSQYTYFVPTRISDVYGNTWDIEYEPDVMPYFDHPLIQSVTDVNRKLEFEYTVRNNKKRIQEVRFHGKKLAEYEYRSSGSHEFLWKHHTGEDWITEYTTDSDPIPAFGSITEIESPTRGVTEIRYELKRIFFQPGNPKLVYAVTRLERGGHTWLYNYQNTNDENEPPPLAPPNDEFKVQVTSDDGFVGDYIYYTYGSPLVCSAMLWKVGLLQKSDESYNGTRRLKILDHEAYQISQATFTNNCASIVATSRLLVETLEQDGHSLTSTYDDHDQLNFPKLITRPGNVTEEISYHHVIVGGTQPIYLLGLRQDEEIRVRGGLIRKTIATYSGSQTLPDPVRFYRNPTTYVSVDLTYYSANGSAGSIKTKEFGRYHEHYEYENGVVSKVEYPVGPHIERGVNRDGTIVWEERNGVRKTFTWDDDFRLKKIESPPNGDADIDIVYDLNNRTVTATQGPTEIRLTYDIWGRLIERRERVYGGIYTIASYDSFDSFDRARREIVPSGAQYEIDYDVHGRLKQRSVLEDAHEYTFNTDSQGVLTRETINGSVRIERKVDFLGRIIRGSTNGYSVDYSYVGTSDGINQTIQPQGLPQRIVKRDFIGNKTEEIHPETGHLTYRYTPAEGWNDRLVTPNGTYDYDLDDLGRIRMKYYSQLPVSPGLFMTIDYHLQYGTVQKTSSMTSIPYESVDVEYANYDAMGRPREKRVSIPYVPNAPTLKRPYDSWHPTGLNSQPGVIGYYPYFIWHPGGNTQSDIEIWSTNYRRVGRSVQREEGRLLFLERTQGNRLHFNSLRFTLIPNKEYCCRVRTVNTIGGAYIGPFSGWVFFKLGGRPRLRFNVPDVQLLLTTCVSASDIGGQVIGASRCPEENFDPVPIDQIVPPQPVITQPVVINGVYKDTFVISFRYDAQGRVEAIQHPEMNTSWIPDTRRGRWQEYTYNARNGHRTVNYDGMSIVNETIYNHTGAVDQIRLSTSPLIRIEHTYDTLGRLSAMRVERGQQHPVNLYHALQMQYNDWGYLRTFRRADLGLSGTLTYHYDDRGRLRQFDINHGNSSGTAVYTYDNASNLISRTAFTVTGLSSYTQGGVSPAELFQPGLAVTNYNNNNQNTDWSYDPGGRLKGDNRHIYEYNALNQVFEVIDRNEPQVGIKAQYLYDADGYRVCEVYDNRIVYSLRGLNGELLTQETHIGSRRLPVRTDYIYHNDSVLATRSYYGHGGARQNYTFRNGLGSPVVELTSPDSPPRYVEYSPHGHQMRTGLFYPLESKIEFAGHERDTNTALDYMMARYYDSRYGRFNRPDPAFDFDETNPASYNLYTYALSNPVNYLDPSGLFPNVSIPFIFNFAKVKTSRYDTSYEVTFFDTFKLGIKDDIRGDAGGIYLGFDPGKVLGKALSLSFGKAINLSAELRLEARTDNLDLDEFVDSTLGIYFSRKFEIGRKSNIKSPNSKDRLSLYDAAQVPILEIATKSLKHPFMPGRYAGTSETRITDQSLLKKYVSDPVGDLFGDALTYISRL